MNLGGKKEQGRHAIDSRQKVKIIEPGQKSVALRTITSVRENERQQTCAVLWGPKSTTKGEMNSQRPIKTPIGNRPSMKSVWRWRLLLVDKILT